MIIRIPGASFRYLYPGAILFILGISTVFSEIFYVGIVFILVGIYLFISPEITEIDSERKRYRKGLSLFGITGGAWSSYHMAQGVFLRRMFEAGTYSVGDVVYNDKTICYEIYIGVQPFISLAEEVDYDEAKFRLAYWSQTLGLPAQDTFREIQRSAVKRRMMRLQKMIESKKRIK